MEDPENSANSSPNLSFLPSLWTSTCLLNWVANNLGKALLYSRKGEPLFLEFLRARMIIPLMDEGLVKKEVTVGASGFKRV